MNIAAITKLATAKYVSPEPTYCVPYHWAITTSQKSTLPRTFNVANSMNSEITNDFVETN